MENDAGGRKGSACIVRYAGGNPVPALQGREDALDLILQGESPDPITKLS